MNVKKSIKCHIQAVDMPDVPHLHVQHYVQSIMGEYLLHHKAQNFIEYYSMNNERRQHQ